MLKIIFIGLCLCLLNIFLKKEIKEFVVPVEIVFLIFAAVFSIEYLQKVLLGFEDIFGNIEYGEEIFASVIKGLGICLLTKFSSDICEENGNKMISGVIEFVGRIMLTVIAVPYIQSIIKIATEFVK